MGFISIGDSLESVFERVIKELKTASDSSSHPFRFMTLATHSATGPQARYVVLRAIDDEWACYFFTDSRTSKVEQIVQVEKVALLFYNAEERIQVRINGIAQEVQDQQVKANFWQNINVEGSKAYTSKVAPGKEIESPEMGHTWHDPSENRYFAVTKIIPQFIDVLQLNGSEHLRAQFKRQENEWEKLWVCP